MPDLLLAAGRNREAIGLMRDAAARLRWSDGASPGVRRSRRKSMDGEAVWELRLRGGDDSDRRVIDALAALLMGWQHCWAQPGCFVAPPGGVRNG